MLSPHFNRVQGRTVITAVLFLVVLILVGLAGAWFGHAAGTCSAVTPR